MTKPRTKIIFYISSLMACIILAINTGCASGGFKFTRGYAQWVNSKPLILRIIIYIFTSVVFAITMLIDLVIFNTIDFWDGKVSQGDYEFKSTDKVYQVRHEILPGSGLKRSTIHIQDLNHKSLQDVVLNETASGEIELFVDGKLRAQARNITLLPIVSLFDQKGNLIQENTLLLTNPILARSVAEH